MRGDAEGTFEAAGSSAKASVEEGAGYESDGKATKGLFSNADSWKALDIYEEQGWSYTLWTYKVIDSGSSWGIYTAALDKVDINNDSVETIKEKWGPDKLGTKAAFTRNDKYADILKSYFAKNVPTLNGASKVSYTKSGLKKNKTYTFKVRAYKTSGKNKVYSAYTGTNKVKM